MSCQSSALLWTVTYLLILCNNYLTSDVSWILLSPMITDNGMEDGQFVDVVSEG